MTKQRPVYSLVIDALRFPLALMIVLLHNNPLGIQVALCDNNLDLYHQYPVYYSIQHLFTNNITRIAVPLFFFFSGFLFFLKYKESSSKALSVYYGGKIKRVLKTIVAPYFIWNAIYILFNLLIQYFFAGYLQGGQLLYKDYVWSDWLHLIWFPAGGHLWYLRDLFIVSICSLPLFFVLRNKILGLCTILLFGCLWAYGTSNIFGVMTIESFFFWSMGSYICLHGIDLSSARKKLPIIAALYIVTLVVEMLLWRYGMPSFIYIERLGICIGALLTLAVTSKLLISHNLEINKLLPKASFFIYLSHSIILLFISRAYTKFTPLSEMSLILEYFIAPILVAALLVWLYKIMSRYTPSLLKVLTGGRE